MNVTESLQEKRSQPRVPFCTKGELVNAITDARCPIQLVDIGPSGIGFCAPFEYDKDSLSIVRFSIDGKSIHGVIRVTNCTPDAERRGRYRIAAEMRHWEEPILRIVLDYLSSHLDLPADDSSLTGEPRASAGG